MFRDIEEVVINCETWCRAGINGDSQLLNDQNAMCCLGFECLNRGLKPSQIRGLGNPCDVSDKFGEAIPDMVLETRVSAYQSFKNNDLVEQCIEINDDSAISDSQRMKKLKEIFKKRGLKIRFVNIPDGVLE